MRTRSSIVEAVKFETPMIWWALAAPVNRGERRKVLRAELRIYRGRLGEAVVRDLVDLVLPRRVLMWAFIRVAADATTGKYADRTPDDVSIMEALKAWAPAGADA